MNLTADIDLKDLVRTIPDYPKPGIMFRDITTLLGNANGFRACVELLDASPKSAGMAEQRGDVAEHDAGLRIVRDRAHEAFQIHFGGHAHGKDLSRRLIMD